jgi:hypothetical protein
VVSFLRARHGPQGPRTVQRGRLLGSRPVGCCILVHVRHVHDWILRRAVVVMQRRGCIATEGGINRQASSRVAPGGGPVVIYVPTGGQ